MWQLRFDPSPVLFRQLSAGQIDSACVRAAENDRHSHVKAGDRGRGTCFTPVSFLAESGLTWGRGCRSILSLNKEAIWQITHHTKTAPFFERSSKRRKGYPSETRVKRGIQIVHGDKVLMEKLGRNDPCPCGSMRRFKNCCMNSGFF